MDLAGDAKGTDFGNCPGPGSVRDRECLPGAVSSALQRPRLARSGAGHLGSASYDSVAEPDGTETEAMPGPPVGKERSGLCGRHAAGHSTAAGIGRAR